MNKVVVLGLIAVLCSGIYAGIQVFSLNVALLNNPQTESITTPSNIIDHLPFIINETDVYYLAKDLTVDGDGITILANNTVLIGRGHLITGDGTGNGIGINASCVTITHCRIANFTNGIIVEQTRNATLISSNIVFNNYRGMLFNFILNNPTPSYDNTIRNNIVVNNNVGIKILRADRTTICNNYFDNNHNADDSSIYSNNWNKTMTAGTNIIGGLNTGGNYWHDYFGADTNGDGIGDTDLPYMSNGNIWHGGDYLPLVDISPPYLDLRSTDTALSNIALNVSCFDNIQVDKVLLELDGVNYTDLSKVDDSLGFTDYEGIWSVPVEYKVTYSRNFTDLSLGPHYYRWFANDTRNQWNSTDLQSFNVVAIPVINSVNVSPVLKISANITCEGTSNISELMNYMALHYEIDDNWFAMSMTFNQQTSLYSALTIEYNQLAGKTIQYYTVAEDKNNNTIVSETFTYQVPDSVESDLNRDGIIDICDIVAVALRFGETIP